MQRLSQFTLIAALLAFVLVAFFATGGMGDSLFIDVAAP